MDHNEIRHMLSEYIDGTLTPEEKASVEQHLGACPECNDAVGELRKTVEHIRKIEEVEPPAWMTQKIMARVRADEGKKKGLFERLFFPLSFKLPLEAIGVLFIAVTVYFVARDVQETNRNFSQAPVQTYARKPTAAEKSRAEDKTADTGGVLQRKKGVPRTPGYNALDRKQEYEKPKAAVPTPAPSATPPLEKQTEKKEPTSNMSSLMAPGNMQERAHAKEFSGRGAAAQAPQASFAKKRTEAYLSDVGDKQVLTLVVPDVDQAAARVEGTVKEYGGKIISKESVERGLSMTVAIDAAGRSRFIDKLKTLGELRDAGYREDGVVEIRIMRREQPK